MTWKKWYGHSIGHNSRSRRPSLFCFVNVAHRERPKRQDCSYVENELRCGAATFVEWRNGRAKREYEWTFTKADGFWETMFERLSNRRVVWCISHNVFFAATYLRLWESIERGTLYASDGNSAACKDDMVLQSNRKVWQGLLAIDGLPFHMELKHKGRRVNFSDLMNYYPLPLETIGQSVGICQNVAPDSITSDADWLSYCKTNVEVIKHAYLSLMENWQTGDNGNWRFSAAGLAWNNFRHTRDCSDIVVHNHGNARDLEWQSYYGGECRAWFRGDCPGPVTHLDVNSLYPSVMAGKEYPVELVDHIVNPSPYIVESLASRYAIVADITMENVWDDIPKRYNGTIIYPVGWFRTSLAGPEFVACIKGNCVSKIHAINYYKRADIFTGYVRRWYESKSGHSKSGNKSGEQFAKLMLNSLFGKFSQRTKAWETVFNVEALRPWCSYPDKLADDKPYEMVRTIGYNVQALRGWRETANTFPAISAYVTSYARQRMAKLRRHIPPSVLYYQDTDSLFVDSDWYNAEGKQVLDIGDELGQLRVVATYKEVTIRGRKNYTADGRDHISGLKRGYKRAGNATYTGIRMETAAKITNRNPDGTIRSWESYAEFPGVCREGGYTAEGWSVPASIALTKPKAPATLMS